MGHISILKFELPILDRCSHVHRFANETASALQQSLKRTIVQERNGDTITIITNNNGEDTVNILCVKPGVIEKTVSITLFLDDEVDLANFKNTPL